MMGDQLDRFLRALLLPLLCLLPPVAAGGSGCSEPSNESGAKDVRPPDSSQPDGMPPPGDPGALKVAAPPGGGIYLGAYDVEDRPQTFHQAIGRPLAISPRLCPGDGGAENTRPKIDIACREARYQQGVVTVFGIEPPYWAENPAYTVQDVIDGKLDAELRQIAAEIARWGRPLLWLYQREPAGQWAGYGPDGMQRVGQCRVEGGNDTCDRTAYGDPDTLDGPERYVDFHRHVHDVVEGELARLGRPTTITWVMGAVIIGEAGWYTAHYPGNEYVDWHAIDLYVGGDGTGEDPRLSVLPRRAPGDLVRGDGPRPRQAADGGRARRAASDHRQRSMHRPQGLARRLLRQGSQQPHEHRRVAVLAAVRRTGRHLDRRRGSGGDRLAHRAGRPAEALADLRTPVRRKTAVPAAKRAALRRPSSPPSLPGRSDTLRLAPR